MIQIEGDIQGAFAWMQRNRGALTQAEVARIALLAQSQAFAEWATRSGDRSLRVRFDPKAFGLLGLRRRSPGYERRHLKAYGKVIPYFSPRRRSYLGAAMALTAPRINPVALLRALAPKGKHARDLTLVPGSGWNLHPLARSRTVVTRFTVRGMRILNRGGARLEIYRRQFLAFGAGGRGDGQWIANRANELAMEHLRAAFAATGKERLT